MAPEQIITKTESQVNMSSRMDIYAFGMTIYALLGGQPPDSNEVLVKTGLGLDNFSAAKSPLSEKDVEEVCAKAQLPGLKNIILKATIFDQTLRYQSVKDLLLDTVKTGTFSLNNYNPKLLENQIKSIPNPAV